MQGKPHRAGPGRSHMQNTRNTHIPNETQLRGQPTYPVQAVMMPRQGSYIAGHPMAMQPRPIRQARPPLYSSSPQGHSPMQGYIPQQNMQYQVVQDPYGQAVMRPTFIHNVQPPYQMQASNAPFQQPQYIPQQPQYYNQGMHAMYYTMPSNQPMQTQQPTQPSNPTIQPNNLAKPKPKRSSKIVIRDPKDNKDVTEQILSHNNAANGRSGGTPPLTNSTAQTESSTIQAQFAAQVAARVGGDKGKHDEKKADETEKDTELQERTDHEIKTEINKQGNGTTTTDEIHAKDLPSSSVDNLNKASSSANENRTDSPKNTTENTHINQESPTLGEMTDKLKKTIEVPQNEPKVVLLRHDREATIKNGANEIKENAPEVLDNVPENNEVTVKRKTSGENIVVPGLAEQTKSDNKDSSLDNPENGVEDAKSLGSEPTSADISFDKAEKKVESVSDIKEVSDKESEPEQEVKVQSQDLQVKPEESHEEIPVKPEVSGQEKGQQHNAGVVEQTQPDKQQEDQQTDVEQQVEKQQQQEDKQQEGKEQQEDKELIEDKQVEKQQSDKQQLQEDKQQQQADKQEPHANKQETQAHKPEQQMDKQQLQTDKPEQKQNNNPKSQEKQPPQKTAELPKKKSSKQRFKDMNKKETGGDLMDAYTDKPPPQEPVVEEKVKPVEMTPEQSEKPLEEDLSWEDKGEKIGDEIKVEKENEAEVPAPVEQTKRKYERDFLLKFQFHKVCTEKPEGLPDIEVVLDAPVPPSKGGGSQRGGSDFLPSFARQKSQGGGGRRDSRGKAPPRKIIPAVPAPPVVLKQSENRWQRPEEKEKELSESEKKSAELYRNVVAILNKLTPQKFKTLVEQIMALNIDTPERLEGVIDRTFEKAIGEPVFSVAYANMCRCLFGIKVADADGNLVSFRKLLLNRCQKEFEKEKEDEEAFVEKRKQLELLPEEEKKAKKEEMDEAIATNKRRMLGNIKFIGELFKLKLLTENIMHDCIFKLLRAGDEESLESMCKLLFTIGKDLESDKAKPRIEQYFDQINKVILAKKVSSRVIFMLRDVIELRQNKWVPRREEHYNPKTIDQIHKEARDEKIQEQRLAAQLPAKDNKHKKGMSGGRDSPKPPQNDGWITPSKSGKSVPIQIDQNKLRNMAKRANNEEISLGPSARFGQWGRGSSAGLNSSSQEQDQPQANRYSALSSSGGGGDLPSNRPYDPRKSNSAGSRPSSGGPRGSDKSRAKIDKDRESAIEAARALAKSQNEKPQVTQPPPPSQEKQEVKVSKEAGKEPVDEPKEPVKEELSEEELAKKTTALIDEYANIRDLKEAITCFTDLHSPKLHHVFILTAVEHTYEMSTRARYDTGKLFAELLSQKKLSKEQLTTGFDNVLELAYDNAIDYPKLWTYLAEVITPVILGDLFTLSDLKPQILKHLIPVGKAAVLLAEILLITKESKGESQAIQIWMDSGISWSQVLPENSKKEDFLSRKNLNFLPNENNDELLRLLRTDHEFKNDSVFAHIEKNFKEEKRKEPEFISLLVTAVAESCIINKDKEDGPDCSLDKLKARKDILRKYLDNNNSLELEALFALQEIYVKYDKPADMLQNFFNTLYDEEVITEEAFMSWKQDEDPSRQEAKGPALQATASFFDWLQAAAVEGSEN